MLKGILLSLILLAGAVSLALEARLLLRQEVQA